MFSGFRSTLFQAKVADDAALYMESVAIDSINADRITAAVVGSIVRYHPEYFAPGPSRLEAITLVLYTLWLIHLSDSRHASIALDAMRMAAAENGERVDFATSKGGADTKLLLEIPAIARTPAPPKPPSEGAV